MKADFLKTSPFLIVLLFNPFPFLVKARKSNADCTRSQRIFWAVVLGVLF